MNNDEPVATPVQKDAKSVSNVEILSGYRDYPTPDTSNLQMGTENTEVLLVVRPAAFLCQHKSHQFVLDMA